MNTTNNHYSKFLEQYDWNYFITCRSHYRLNTLTAENWVNRLLKASNKVNQVFYVLIAASPTDRYSGFLDTLLFIMSTPALYT